MGGSLAQIYYSTARQFYQLPWIIIPPSQDVQNSNRTDEISAKSNSCGFGNRRAVPTPFMAIGNELQYDG
jgi:hypothetical protein